MTRFAWSTDPFSLSPDVSPGLIDQLHLPRASTTAAAQHQAGVGFVCKRAAICAAVSGLHGIRNASRHRCQPRADSEPGTDDHRIRSDRPAACLSGFVIQHNSERLIKRLNIAFMKLGDIKGEATDQDHKDWILLESMSSPVYRSIPEGAKDQQRTKGDTTLGDIVVVRQLDKSSTKLQEACANGTFYKEVQIDFCTTVKNKQEPYLTYKLKNVIVTSHSFHGTARAARCPASRSPWAIPKSSDRTSPSIRRRR
jgi:type VI secretion system secreted protein Hcp